ncbi:MAG: hypothetical protein ACOX2F_10805 [bacterium]
MKKEGKLQKEPAISKMERVQNKGGLLKNIFESEELDEKVVSSILEITTQHGSCLYH